MAGTENVKQLSSCNDARAMIVRAKEEGVETVWDRLAAQEPQCGYCALGVSCRNCSMGPCRVDPFGEGPQKGVCGADADIIVARNLGRTIAAGAYAHSDHGRDILEVFGELAEGTTSGYSLRDETKLKAARDEMAKQMKAERERRATVTEAEGNKRSAILTAEGERDAAIAEAEGDKKAKILRAEAEAAAIEGAFDACGLSFEPGIGVRYSEINAAINSKYAEAGIVIAFPQRDIHLDTRRPLDIRMVQEEG